MYFDDLTDGVITNKGTGSEPWDGYNGKASRIIKNVQYILYRQRKNQTGPSGDNQFVCRDGDGR